MLVVVFISLLLASTAWAFLTDTSVHKPPVTGTYDYQAWKPGAVGFPAVGGSYTDPVFGGTVRRLTDAYTTSQPNAENIYGHHWANADGTYVFSTQVRAGVYTATFILDTTTGAEVYTGQPEGSSAADMSWHPTDPDKYYYYSGASLMRRNLAAQTSTTVKTFGATLQPVGGSLNWIDKTGRYMVVKYSDLAHVWDSQTDTLYSGAFTPIADSNGYVAITPDGNYLVSAAGPTAQPQKEHYSYAINHTTQTIAAPVQFWGLCGDHGALMSASDGKSYFITFECQDVAGIWRVDITLDQAGRTPTQQRADNTLLIVTNFNQAGHVSAISRGALSDWVFFADEDITDNFDEAPPSDWPAYAQEIMAVNVTSLERRRLAHHRSRSITDSYYYFPRLTCSWDGSIVLWTSNFNTQGITDYSDLYAVPFSPNLSSARRNSLRWGVGR